MMCFLFYVLFQRESKSDNPNVYELPVTEINLRLSKEDLFLSRAGDYLNEAGLHQDENGAEQIFCINEIKSKKKDFSQFYNECILKDPGYHIIRENMTQACKISQEYWSFDNLLNKNEVNDGIELLNNQEVIQKHFRFVESLNNQIKIEIDMIGIGKNFNTLFLITRHLIGFEMKYESITKKINTDKFIVIGTRSGYKTVRGKLINPYYVTYMIDGEINHAIIDVKTENLKSISKPWLCIDALGLD